MKVEVTMPIVSRRLACFSVVQLRSYLKLRRINLTIVYASLLKCPQILNGQNIVYTDHKVPRSETFIARKF